MHHCRDIHHFYLHDFDHLKSPETWKLDVYSALLQTEVQHVYDVDVDVCSMYLTVVVGDNHVLK
jgi:hypothetical protein